MKISSLFIYRRQLFIFICLFFGLFFTDSAIAGENNYYCDCSINLEVYLDGEDKVGCDLIPISTKYSFQWPARNFYNKDKIIQEFYNRIIEQASAAASNCGTYLRGALNKNFIDVIDSPGSESSTEFPDGTLKGDEATCGLLDGTVADVTVDRLRDPVIGMRQSFFYKYNCDWKKDEPEPEPEPESEPESEKDCGPLGCTAGAAFKELNKLKLSGDNQAAQLIGRVIKTAMQVIGSIALIIFVAGGLMWMTARGNSERISTALKMITWASLGIIVILSSYVIVEFVFGIFK